MDYFLTEEQKEIQELTRKIAEEQVLPIRAELDEKERFPREILDILGETGLSGVYIPQEYGGFGGGIFNLCLVTEQLSRVCSSVAVSFACNALGSYPIIIYGTEEQKRKYLPDIASGKKLAAFGLTEPTAGSDAGGIQTTAKKTGDHYVLNGTKQWITNGEEADTYIVIALTDKSRGARGASAFIVEKGMEGFSFGKKEKKMGIRASATCSLFFEDCVVPKENLLGKEGTGFLITMKNLDKSRPGIGAQAVGLAQGAMEEAVKFARERHQFDKPIISFQAVQHLLADMAIQIEAARALVYSVARYVDTNPKEVSKVSSITKVFASDVAMKVTVDAVQVFGGHGYMREYPVEKMMRDAKILQIYEGTNQIQRNVIGLYLNKECARKGR
jgi:alkylation response protein AidB-like acyl-CoA dehydrogenase